MKRAFLALAVSGVVLGLGAGPAMADGGFSGQAAEQVAGSQQYAEADANSTQYNPSNSNTSVRVLSPGDDGDVTQANNSYAQADAGNENDTTQTVDQSQSGAGQTAVQEALQKAGNQQAAISNAESTQVNPQNRNISVRVLSPGDNGDVSQENNSEAKSKAHNTNELDQELSQDQSGSCCEKKAPQYEKAPEKKAPEYGGKKDDHSSPCCHGGTGIQAAGQEAYNKQYADADAESKQVKPSNSNIAVRVLSPGDDGDVDQSNSSSADAQAYNDNDTDQSIDQSQRGGGCGCYGGEQIQAAGQAAYNWQKADADADSKQYYPENKALSFRFWSWGDSGYLNQANDSSAYSRAANRNDLDQALSQAQGG